MRRIVVPDEFTSVPPCRLCRTGRYGGRHGMERRCWICRGMMFMPAIMA